MHAPPEKNRNLRSSNCWKCIEIVNLTITLLFLYRFKYFTIPSGGPFWLLDGCVRTPPTHEPVLVTAMVGDEPGPAKDYLKCDTTTASNCQFFFNKSYLVKYSNAKTDAAKHSVPRYHYFKKIYSFMDSHCIIGELFLEYLKGGRNENGESGTLCDFYSTREQCREDIEHFLTMKVMRIIAFLCLKVLRDVSFFMRRGLCRFSFRFTGFFFDPPPLLDPLKNMTSPP